MLAKVYSAALNGLEALPIEVEADLSPGLFCFQIVGLADKAINEAKDRISSAIKNSGIKPPQHSRKRVVVNLAPADLKKQGTFYDLPIAVSYLVASHQINIDNSDDLLFVGELSLDGKLRKSSGILPIADMAKQQRFDTLFVPVDNAAEAALIKGLNVIGVASLKDLILHFQGQKTISPTSLTKINQYYNQPDVYEDMSFIKGQAQAKRALEIAAAGAHNVLFHGPPGAGKTLLARALASILPFLNISEALEVTRIYSVAGHLEPDQALVTNRSFRSPHHTASTVSLIGGGNYLRPGEITLAHRGVLFLDEMPEYSRSFLESLRQPLEDGVVTIARARGSVTYPAKFILVGAMNPCPCGKLGDSQQPCTCTHRQISNYQKKISGPLLDRIDLHVEVAKLKQEDYASDKLAEASEQIRRRIQRAREIQDQRYSKEDNVVTNSELDLKQIKKYCILDNDSQMLLTQAINKLNLSARGYYRIIKIARTIADLAESITINQHHIAEAVQFRGKKM